MVRILGLVTVLAACGSSQPAAGVNQQAIDTFFDIYTTAQSIEQDALAAQPAVAPVVQTIDYTGPCATSGTAAMHGTYDDGDGSTRANYTFDVAAMSCVAISSTIDGTMHWVGSVSGAQAQYVYTETLNGAMTVTGADYVGTFAFQDIKIVTTVMGTTSTATMSGTYTIGGQTYMVDSASWSAYFGG